MSCKAVPSTSYQVLADLHRCHLVFVFTMRSSQTLFVAALAAAANAAPARQIPGFPGLPKPPGLHGLPKTPTPPSPGPSGTPGAPGDDVNSVAECTYDGEDDGKFDYSAVSLREVGARNTLDWRIWLLHKCNPISFWHDVPLYPYENDTKIINVVVEIPRWTDGKIELESSEALTPIFHDDRNDAPRFVESVYPHRSYPFVYGSVRLISTISRFKCFMPLRSIHRNNYPMRYRIRH